MLLVASPLLGDPNFMRSVVYLLEHHQHGSLGLIINRPLPLPLADLWLECPETVRDWRICAEGGPVERERGLLLHGHPGIPDAHRLADGLWIGGAPAALAEAALAAGDPGLGPRLFLGNSGWAPGQLVDELDAGSWLLRPGHPRLLLDPEPDEELWRDLAGASGRGASPSSN